MATRLQLYNRALRIIQERKLSSLTEKREPRFLLDDVWEEGGVRACLSRGFWNHATRTVQIDYDPSQEPDFGLSRVFVKPDDWVRTSAFCSDPYFQNPLSIYDDTGAYWYADIDTVYVKYISDDASYGNNLSLWTEGFFNYAAHYFAVQIAPNLTSAASKVEDLKKDLKKALNEAKSEDGQNEPARRIPPGSWVRARTRGGRLSRER